MVSKWFSLAKFAAVIGLCAYALVTFNAARNEAADLRDAIITESAAKISSQAEAQELRNAQILLEDALQIQIDSINRANAAIRELNAEYSEYRREADAQIAVFAEHDLEALTNAKPELLERLANRATRQRFDEFELVFDGT